MNSRKPSYRDRVAEIRKRRSAARQEFIVTNAYKRKVYAQRLTGILVIAIGLPLMLPAYLISHFFGVSPYTCCVAAIFVSIVLSVLLAQEISNKKYGDE